MVDFGFLYDVILIIISSWLIDFISCHHVLKPLIKMFDYATSAWVTYEFDFILNGNSLKLYNGAIG
jgi:hypothetical protein